METVQLTQMPRPLTFCGMCHFLPNLLGSMAQSLSLLSPNDRTNFNRQDCKTSMRTTPGLSMCEHSERSDSQSLARPAHSNSDIRHRDRLTGATR
jgi:hypothetical protein